MNVKRGNDGYVIQTNDYTIVVKNDMKFNLYKLAHDVNGDANADAYQNYYDISMRDALKLTGNDQKLNEVCFAIYDNITKANAEEQYETYVTALEQQVNQQTVQQMQEDMEKHETPQTNEADAELIRELLDQIEMLNEQVNSDMRQNSELAEFNDILNDRLKASSTDNTIKDKTIKDQETQLNEKDKAIKDQETQLNEKDKAIKNLSRNIVTLNKKLNVIGNSAKDIDKLISVISSVKDNIYKCISVITKDKSDVNDVLCEMYKLIERTPYILIVRLEQIYNIIKELYVSVTDGADAPKYKIDDIDTIVNEINKMTQSIIDQHTKNANTLIDSGQRCNEIKSLQTKPLEHDFSKLIETIRYLCKLNLKIPRSPLAFIRYLHDFINSDKLYNDHTFDSIKIAHRWDKTTHQILNSDNTPFYTTKKDKSKIPSPVFCKFNLFNNFYYGQENISSNEKLTPLDPIRQLFQLPDINIDDIKNPVCDNIPSTYIRTFNKDLGDMTFNLFDTINESTLRNIPALVIEFKSDDDFIIRTSERLKQCNTNNIAKMFTDIILKLNNETALNICYMKKSPMKLSTTHKMNAYNALATLTILYNRLFKSMEQYACLSNNLPDGNEIKKKVTNYVKFGLNYLAICILLMDILLLHIGYRSESDDSDKLKHINQVIVYFTLFSATVMKKIKDTANIKDEDIKNCSAFLNAMLELLNDSDDNPDLTRLAVYCIYYTSLADEDSIKINGISINFINDLIENIDIICAVDNEDAIKQHFGKALRPADDKTYANTLKTLVENKAFEDIVKRLTTPDNELIDESKIAGAYREKLHGGFEFHLSDKAKYILKIIGAVIFILALIAVVVVTIVTYRNKHIEEQYTVRFIK